MDSPTEPRAKLFVGGLNRETTDDKLREYFEPYGELTDVVVICDSQTKKSRGFGYVTFADYRNTRNVLKDKADKGAHSIDGKEVEVKRAIPREDAGPTAHEKTKKIFIGGLPEDVTKEEIQEAVEKVLEDNVTNVSLIMKKDDETRHRGFCFIELANEDLADELCCVKKIPIKGKMSEAKKATPRDRDRQEGGGRGGGRGGRGGGQGRFGGGSSYGGYGGGSYDSYGGGGGYGDSYGYGSGGYGGGYGSGGYDSYGGMGMYGQSSSGYGKSYGSSRGGMGRGGGGRYKPY